MEPAEAEPEGKRPKRAAAASPEAALSDDLLREILVRLPDTSSLARAALSCNRWRRAASDPAFLRRFHARHGPPLLGFILSGPPPRLFTPIVPLRRFLPATRRASRNPHLAAVTAACDFHFKGFAAYNPRSGSVVDEWLLRDCDVGRLLLSYGFIEYEELAVYDPVARTAHLLRRPDLTRFDFEFLAVHYALVADEAAAEFRVFAAQFWNGRVLGAVYCSRTREWAPLPPLRAPEPWNIRGGMRAGRFAYWQSNTNMNTYYSHFNYAEHALVLDTTTMAWSLIQVPFSAKESYCVADMPEHGGLCLVASTEQRVQLWVRRGDGDGGGWVIKKEVWLLKSFEILKRLRREEWMKRVRILAARDGYVYMEFWSIRNINSYLLVLNWDTMELSMIANYSTEKYRGPAFPLFMSWAPPFLRPANELADRLQDD